VTGARGIPRAGGLPAPGSAGAWWLAIRPRTLPAAVAPVLVGAALAWSDQAFRPLPALAALAGALLIQIGTNLANDVLDYRKGADTAERIGPTRVVQAGLLSPRAVAGGAAASFALAAAVGLYLILGAGGGWPILVLGLAALASGVLYTAGPYPLAYVGLGDLFVMAFFGLGAVAGTYYVQALKLTPAALGLGVAIGALATAILVVNNLRDVDTDRAAGKRTLVVRLGAPWARRYYTALIALAFALPPALVLLGWLSPFGLAALAALPSALPPARAVRSGASGRALLPVLGLTATLETVFALCLAAGLVVAGWVGAGVWV
jgi:1,4-dihydroxy-2-naphthoate octaprenyltransferase